MVRKMHLQAHSMSSESVKQIFVRRSTHRISYVTCSMNERLSLRSFAARFRLRPDFMNLLVCIWNDCLDRQRPEIDNIRDTKRILTKRYCIGYVIAYAHRLYWY